MGKMKNTYKILVEKSEGKRPLRIPRRRREDNITMFLKEIGREGVDWIHVAQDRGQWRACVKTIMNLQIPERAGNFLTSRVTINVSRRTLLHGVSSP
jgi:hypothetical protein